ncbi:MAG: enolase C-terminal domain-like protein, partial [Pseudomonadota bacterium]
NAAKAAMESALFDALGKRLNVPIHVLLGGAVRTHIPVLWALASGDPAQEVEEALSMIEAGRHRDFKIKIGAKSPVQDIKRLEKIVLGLGDRGHLKVIDANQAWDETTADRYIPVLEELGISILEQPLPDWNVDGMARLAARHSLPLLADESVFSAHDAARVARSAAADAVSLKLVKSGGLLAMCDIAALADANGLGLYGGCLLETTIGAASHLHVFATLPSLHWGSESFGPLILQDEIASKPLTYRDYGVEVPKNPGLGVTLDEDKTRFYTHEGGH